MYPDSEPEGLIGVSGGLFEGGVVVGVGMGVGVGVGLGTGTAQPERVRITMIKMTTKEFFIFTLPNQCVILSFSHIETLIIVLFWRSSIPQVISRSNKTSNCSI